MKTNPEHIPNEVFDWIQSSTFEALLPTQQAIVMDYFSKQEYNEMHDACLLLASNSTHKPAIHSRKEILMDQFDLHHATNQETTLSSSTIFWKVAAILLFVTSICLSYYQLTHTHIEQTNTLVQHDTIYIDRSIPSPEKSVQMPENGQPKNSMLSANNTKHKMHLPKKYQSMSHPKSEPSQEDVASSFNTNTDIRTVSIQQINSISNIIKRNSRRHDTLEKNFRFVSL